MTQPSSHMQSMCDEGSIYNGYAHIAMNIIMGILANFYMKFGANKA